MSTSLSAMGASSGAPRAVSAESANPSVADSATPRSAVAPFLTSAFSAAQTVSLCWIADAAAAGRAGARAGCK